jgi:UDP-N-acetylglucosamine--N-acetylmuramyl-(pentapeptide) pyrophosphoryl-undecaprenol N-acetylglucosamine transferase
MMKILIAGGGTGGHLFPGIAIAEAFMEKDQKNEVLFVGTGRPFEVSVLSQRGFRHKSVTAEGLKGRGLWNQLAALSKIPRGIIESIGILREFKPNLVLGVGGYSAGPVVMAAWVLRLKVALQEQNILPGITNRTLSRFADRIYVSFENTKFPPRYLNKMLVTGNPVRKDIRNWEAENRKPDSPFTVLIIGGSQGAHSINMAVAEALRHIKQKDKFFFVHQTGEQDIIAVKDAYKDQGISCTVQPFFNDMATLYRNADLMICRAGATTIAEITAIGKAVIFIPYPYAADNHQVFNAKTLADAGAAEMILQKELDGELLARRITYYAENPEELKKMAYRAKAFGKPDAAEAIVEDFYRMVMRDVMRDL